MHPIDLLQWWNLIFDLPFVAALIPLLLQATGAAHFGHGGHGVHLGHGHGGFEGHHAHLPHLHLPHVPHIGHHHIETGTPHVSAASASGAAHAPAVAHQPQSAHETAAHHVEGPGPISRALGLLGIGKVPIMLVFSSFCFVWGFTGLVANQFLAGVFPFPSLFILPSIGIALVSSLLLTSVLSQGISKIMPSLETYTTPKEGFVGKTGHALYEINAKSGAAVVLDNESNRVQIKCRAEDEGAAILKGRPIAVTRYDEQTEIFVVREMVLTDEEQAQLSQLEKRLKKPD